MAYQSEIEKLEQRFGEKPEQWFAALADAYRKAGELDMALDILNTWIEKRPNYTSGHIVRGRCLLDRSEDEEAGKAFQGVLELDPENIIAIKALSDIATRAGDTGQARHWLQRLLEVDPMNEEAHAALEATSQPAALEPAELNVVPAERAAEAPGEPGPSDLLAVAGELRESGRREQPKEEATLEIEPPARPVTAAPELTVETAPEVEGLTPGIAAPLEAPTEPEAPPARPPVEAPAPVDGLETRTVDAEAGADTVDASGLEIEAFDEEMGWDAGERISHAITQEDLQEALEAHEDSLDAPAHALPGIEAEEVPHVGVEERETAPVEGLDVPPEVPEEEPEPVAGFEPTAEEGEAAAAEAPETERTTGPPLLTPVEAPKEEAEEALPLILPEAVSTEEEAPPAEPEPVLTETMAEVYVAQGHLDQARAIYRKLLEQQPGNAALAAKLADLDSRGGAAVPAPAVEERFAAPAAAGASVSAMLAEILGVEPQPALAPPPRPEGAEPRVPVAPPPAAAPAPSAPPSAPAPKAAPKAGEGGEFSFDEFFGGEEPSGGPGPSTRRAASHDGSDDDFRNWLKSLKT